jgi:hypothetical protein
MSLSSVRLPMPQPPTPPAAPPPPATATPPAAVQLQAQAAVLRERASDLRSEREDLVDQVKEAVTGSPAMTSLTGRLTEVERQLTQTETSLRGTEDRLATLGVGPDGERFTETGVAPRPERDMPSRDIPENVMGVIVISLVFVAMPISVTIARYFWKRSVSPTKAATLPSADAERLTRMEQAIDTIAVELERISEGQRFVTRLLSDDRALSAGAAEAVPVPQRQSEPVRHP